MKLQCALFLVIILKSCCGNPVQVQEDIQVQENFDLSQIYGKWYDIAVGSTCKWLKQFKDKFNMGTLVLGVGETSDTISTTSTRLKGGKCTQVHGAYQKTNIPGKFNYYSPKWGMTIVSYVVYTNYNEYAIILMRKTKNAETSTTVKLYGRSPEVRESLMGEFRQFALDQGILENSIFTLINKGECVPGESQVPSEVSQMRIARSVLTKEEGSGMDESISPQVINKEAACRLNKDAGPCLGMNSRFFYNFSSMACETFNYGGCFGNGNNFFSEKECLQTCRTEAACRLQIKTGPCRAVKNHWAFDSSQGKCVTFIYGGCQGNGNKFYTEKECKEYCGMLGDDEEFLAVSN
uniref:Protein AMBP n=1 Tax=Geotrypetes seraphini TaxID=260995 RepID=A0A6P8SGE0_GEOSA|nr:prostaglandin-H2 D-isomerase isoform X2 [Geotrypetes seraphini]